MTPAIYLALVAIIATLLAVVLELLCREAAALKAKAARMKDLGLRQISKDDAGVERKRLP